MLNKEKLKELVDLYKVDFHTIWPDEQYKWLAVEHFQKYWDIEAENFFAMFVEATRLNVNLLQSRNFFPLQMMIELIQANPERVRQMFRDLYNEDNNALDRMDTFIKEADAMKMELNWPERKSHFHYHNVVTTYLWFRYPDEYYIYKFPEFKAMTERLETGHTMRAGADRDNVTNGFALYDQVREYLKADPEIRQMMNQVLTDNHYPDPEYRTLTVDLGHYVYAYFREWWPTKKEYDPRLSVADWRGLLDDKDIFTEKSLTVMKRFLQHGGQGTCTEIAEKFGESYQFYSNEALWLAERIANKKGISFYQKPDGTSARWPLLFMGKGQDSDKAGVFIWRLRDELKAALKLKDLSHIRPNNDPYNDIRIHKLNQILYGPPGTGKTYSTVEYALAIIENRSIDTNRLKPDQRIASMDKYKKYVQSGQIVFTTFHQSYGYEEFIQGIRPDLSGDELRFEQVDGILKRLAEKAHAVPTNNFVLIIDEINRGNISKVFGELITLIEEDKRSGEVNEIILTLPSGDEFKLPNNLYLVGTMNSADKSISLIDAALRRRFHFVEITPQAGLIDDQHVRNVFQTLNDHLQENLKSTDLLIGHSYFMNKDVTDLPEIMNNQVIPLLYEYFFDDRNRIENAIKASIRDTDYALGNNNLGRLRIHAK